MWALLDLRDHRGHQALVMMDVQVLQDHLDLQDLQAHFLEYTGPITVSLKI